MLDAIFGEPGKRPLEGTTVGVEIVYLTAGQGGGGARGAIGELSQRAEYDVEKETIGYARVQAVVRCACMSTTFLFACLYLRAIWGGWADLKGWEGMGLEPGVEEWWMTPVALVPERR